MIILQMADTNPLYGHTIMTVLSGPFVNTVSEVPALEFCILDYESEYFECVFGGDANEDYQNDQTSVIFRKQIATDTIVWNLKKDGVTVAILNTNALGTYYPTFDNQPEQLGFLLDFQKVLVAHGSGVYQIESVINQLGQDTTKLSRKFQLLPFTEEAADGTVKIETFQNGNIRNIGVDYTGINWKQSVRIKGKFGDKQPLLEINNYVDSSYKKQQIVTVVNTEWTLETNLLTNGVSDELIYDNLTGNDIFITDYNLLNNSITYKRVSTSLQDIEANHKENNTKSTYNFIFGDRLENNRKTNY